MKKFLIKAMTFSCVILVVSSLLAGGIIKLGFWLDNILPVEPMAVISVARAEVEEEMPMKLWVLKEVYKAGLNPNEADCIISKESNWKEDAIGSTKDYGLWQISIQHKKTIPLKDMFDYKASTKWAIEKRLHDKNWGAWVAWKACK
jgi:hypothetical protein